MCVYFLQISLPKFQHKAFIFYLCNFTGFYRQCILELHMYFIYIYIYTHISKYTHTHTHIYIYIVTKLGLVFVHTVQTCSSKIGPFPLIWNSLPGASVSPALATLGDSKELKGEAHYFQKCQEDKGWPWAAPSDDVTAGSTSAAATKCDLWHVRCGRGIFTSQNEQMGRIWKKQKK